MDKNTKTLIIAFACVALMSALAIFYRYIILEDINFITDEEAFQASLLEE